MRRCGEGRRDGIGKPFLHPSDDGLVRLHSVDALPQSRATSMHAEDSLDWVKIENFECLHPCSARQRDVSYQ